jgi:hypothetical protein
VSLGLHGELHVASWLFDMNEEGHEVAMLVLLMLGWWWWQTAAEETDEPATKRRGKRVSEVHAPTEFLEKEKKEQEAH